MADFFRHRMNRSFPVRQNASPIRELLSIEESAYTIAAEIFNAGNQILCVTDAFEGQLVQMDQPKGNASNIAFLGLGNGCVNRKLGFGEACARPIARIDTGTGFVVDDKQTAIR